MAYCPVCGGTAFTDRPILWDALVAAWELARRNGPMWTDNRGTRCRGCGANLRSSASAEALLGAVGGSSSPRGRCAIAS
jgi:hypothetical protein